MYTTTIGAVRTYRDRTPKGIDFCVYAIGDRSTTFYVGKVEGRHILDRVREHWGDGTFSWAQDISELGNLIQANAPASDRWRIKLLTLEDCAPLIRKHFPMYKIHTPDVAESAIIRTWRPCLNVIHNEDARPLPNKYIRTDESRIARTIRRVLGEQP